MSVNQKNQDREMSKEEYSVIEQELSKYKKQYKTEVLLKAQGDDWVNVDFIVEKPKFMIPPKVYIYYNKKEKYRLNNKSINRFQFVKSNEDINIIVQANLGFRKSSINVKPKEHNLFKISFHRFTGKVVLTCIKEDVMTDSSDKNMGKSEERLNKNDTNKKNDNQREIVDISFEKKKAQLLSEGWKISTEKEDDIIFYKKENNTPVIFFGILAVALGVLFLSFWFVVFFFIVLVFGAIARIVELFEPKEIRLVQDENGLVFKEKIK